MAFIARQNKITFDGSYTEQTFNLAVLRLAIKTILDAAEAEKTAHSRDSAYWYLDPTRASGGDQPSAVGASDNAIYELTTYSKGVGVFLKNGAGETALLFFNGNNEHTVGSYKDDYSISFYPIIGSSTSSNDNMQLKNYGTADSYGLGLCVSKNDFGGLSTPWENGFFVDGDIKPLSDGCSGEGYAYDSGQTIDIIVCIDGKNIIIDRRLSYYGKTDNLLCYGDLIIPDDNTDTERDVLFCLQQNTTEVSSFRFSSIFRDKSGSTTFNPNGSDYNYARGAMCGVSRLLINGSNSNSIPYSGIQFGWQSLNNLAPNSVLNADGRGYKGLSDTSIIKALTADAMIENKTVYNNNLYIIAQFLKDTQNSFSLGIAWDPSNPTIEN
jgi:hypothetical protein